jgi:hypothetical protein
MYQVSRAAAITRSPLATALSEITRSLASALRDKLLQSRSWRITGVRQDDARQRQDFKSKHLEELTGRALQAALTDVGSSLTPPHAFRLPRVSLTDPDAELVVYVRGGLLALGWADAHVRSLQAARRLGLAKGAVMSRTRAKGAVMAAGHGQGEKLRRTEQTPQRGKSEFHMSIIIKRFLTAWRMHAPALTLTESAKALTESAGALIASAPLHAYGNNLYKY